MQKKFLTTDEINYLYGIEADVVNELVEAGDLKALPDRGTVKYRREDVNSLIKSGKLHPTKELPEVGEDAVGSDLEFPVQESAGGEKVDFLELDEDALAADSDAKVRSGDSSKKISAGTGPVLDATIGTGSDSDIHLKEKPAAAPGDAVTEPDFDLMNAEPEGGHVLDETDEEGITLAPEDSGITLEVGDSGITLAGDSGITLKPDSGITIENKTKPSEAEYDLEDFDFASTEADAPVLAKPESEEIPGLFGETPADATEVIDTEMAKTSSFSGAVAAGGTVQDLEVSDELEEAVFGDEEVAEAEAEEEFADEDVIDASEEVFGEEGDEGELAAAPGKPKVTEPTWGMVANLSIIAASVLIGLNVWLIFEGLNTMWSGAPTSGPAASIISSLQSILGS